MKNRKFFDCPIESAMEVIGGKWKAIILYYLIDGEKRFTELTDLLETVSSRMLSRQLRELEFHGIISRDAKQEIPPRVEYSLTEYGKTLVPVVQVICAWGEQRLEKTGSKSFYN
jgi:DNA-binding HxlR family transcriptional regulator